MSMTKRILVSTVILLAVGCIAQAQETELHGSIDLTYLSKYLWRGFDIYGDKSAIQPSIDLDLYGTGLGFSAMGHRANSGEYENFERWDYTLYYDRSYYEDETYAMLCRLGWAYYNYPDGGQEERDLHEIHTILSWPKIIPAGIVPSYYLVKLWPSSSGSQVGSKSTLGGTASGWLHIFMFDYAWTVEGLLPNTPEQVLNLHAEFVFNDGFGGPNGQEVDHDWSNAVFGISTDFDLADNVALTPGVYHQMTMDSSVNEDKDETWLALSMTYKF
jgi:hypothetical protein